MFSRNIDTYLDFNHLVENGFVGALEKTLPHLGSFNFGIYFTSSTAYLSIRNENSLALVIEHLTKHFSKNLKRFSLKFIR